MIDKIEVKAGHGYWDLAFYPWGGSFKRFKSDSVLTIKRVVSQYKDGSPRQVIAVMDNREVGIEL